MENNFDKIVEALLFSTDEPLTSEKISDVLTFASPEQVKGIIQRDCRRFPGLYLA